MPIRTLIVDDDPAVVRLHTRYLAQLDGFELVGSVGTGAAAARFATDAPVDLVLLDMNLPDFSGVEVLRRLRLVREWGVDVIVISSARDPFTVRQALAAHIVDYLVKPFTREAFLSRLTNYRVLHETRSDDVAVRLGQGDIDGLLDARSARASATGAAGATFGRSFVGDGREGEGVAEERLPKGLADTTMRLVRDALDPHEPSSVRDIALRSGASRPTVRRYLDHLVRTGEVDTSHRFGSRGRPEVLYRRVIDF